MAVIGNAPFQGLVSGGNIIDASIEGVDLSTSAIAARLGYTPVDPGAAVFSANPTISSGVANGVAYLNGSKVVTTGSALTFDGSTNFSFTGTGLYPVIAVYPTGNNAIFGFRLDASAGNGIDWRVEQGRSAVGDFNIGAPSVNPTPQYVILKNLSAQYWSIGSSEQMRLTSAGLGIGTNSPAAKLQSNVARTSGTNVTALVLSDTVTGLQTSGYGTQIQGWSNNGSAQSAIGFEAYGGTNNDTALGFYTQAVAGGLTRQMTISSTGNVGIGTGLPSYKLDVYSSAEVVGRFARVAGSNALFVIQDPTTTYAPYIASYGNAMAFGRYGGGESMRLAANGDLNVGTTVGGARLIVGTSETKGQNATPFSLTTNDASNRFELVVARNTNSYYSFQAVEQNVAYRNIVLQQEGGRVGIGQTDPQEKLDVNGNIYIHTATGNPYLKIKTDGAGNNPYIRLQADTNYWDIQGTFSNTNDEIYFMYNGSSKMVIDGVNGKIAIGNNSTSPQLTLDLGDATGNRGISWGGTAANYVNIWTTYGSADLNIGTNVKPSGTNTGYYSSFADPGTSRNIIRVNAFNANGIQFFTDTQSSVAVGTAVTPSERVRITPGGNVLVGTQVSTGQVASYNGTVVAGSFASGSQTFGTTTSGTQCTVSGFSIGTFLVTVVSSGTYHSRAVYVFNSYDTADFGHAKLIETGYGAAQTASSGSTAYANCWFRVSFANNVDAVTITWLRLA